MSAGLSIEPMRDQEQGGGAGLKKLDYPLLQLFPNSCAADIVIDLLRTEAVTAEHTSCFALAKVNMVLNVHRNHKAY